MRDHSATQPAEQLQELMAKAIGLFIDAHVNSRSTALKSLEQMLVTQNPLIASFKRK